MIPLRLRTEFSFRRVYGSCDRVAATVAAHGATHAAITDVGTWGHPAWARACAAHQITPIFGTEIAVVTDAREKTKATSVPFTFLARNNAGLEELYQLVTRAGSLFFYEPRLDYRDVNAVTSNLVVLAGPFADLTRLQNRPHVYLQLQPGERAWNQRALAARGWSPVVTCENFYPTLDDEPAYEILAHNARERRTVPMHIPNAAELRALLPDAPEEAWLNTARIAADCTATLPQAQMVVPEKPETLVFLCLQGAKARGLIRAGAWEPSPDPRESYPDRLERELRMIEQKQFTDYFHVIADLVTTAKQSMLVGPGRGSSAGSLVCYLLGITDVNPLAHGLLFERFIDVTRADLPDIDIDFPDAHRERAIESLRVRYGADRVGRIGTVLRYQAKSTLDLVGIALGLPPRVLADTKATAEEIGVEAALRGNPLLAQHPGVALAVQLEEHASTSGTHAAGVIVCDRPVTTYCGVDRNGTAMIDKKDAETQGMLKIDCLGLRTLSVLQDCLEQIGQTRDWLVQLPLTDVKAYDIINAGKFAGIFQFEGYTLQNVAASMTIDSFDDIAALSALARPGPLHSGSTDEFVRRRTGKEPVAYLHATTEPITRDTQGVIVYQEQFMQICRDVGDMPWESVSKLRRGINQKLGEDAFDAFFDEFAQGATQKMTRDEARKLWDRLITFGAYGFNKSHAVAYAVVTYWCAYLKAYYPLEFAAATLRNAKDDAQALALLRELLREGYRVVPFDRERSQLTWSVQDGVLYGGLTSVRGIGEAKAREILDRRASGQSLTPGLANLLVSGATPFDTLFHVLERYGEYYTNPTKFNILNGSVVPIDTVRGPGEYTFIGQVTECEIRNLNDAAGLAKRKGRAVRGSPHYAVMTVGDHTDTIRCTLLRDEFRKHRAKFESSISGKWVLWKGRVGEKGRGVTVLNMRLLD